ILSDLKFSYEGRASLEVDTNGYISKLSLKKVTMQDSRRYQCSVRIPGDDEGTLAATTSLLVLVPPSPPICKIQGTAEYWQNISLTCQSEEGSPKPVPEWKRFSVENIPKPFPPKTTESIFFPINIRNTDGVLSLFNISIETSGFYICTSTNRIGSASCNLTLAVMPGSMNIGSTAAIIGGVLAGVVLLGIIIFCCCRKKGKNEDNVEDSPAKVFYDRDAPEVGEKYLDEKPNRDTKQSNQKENKDKPKFEDDQHGNSSGEEGHVQERDTDSQRYQYDQENPHRGSRDRLDDKPNHYGGSRDRLDDKRDHYGGSRDRLDDRRDHYGGSRDRLDDRRDRYGGSRDRLDDRRDRYGGSRDRLD
uniref:Ig-like domain-containing protein n=1 Tax=Mola mola TaxID=94237 RepID=A0A3Q3XCV8_MOLML